MPVSAPVQHSILFGGHNTSNQVSLWTTDGTAAGTQEITGIQGASTSSFYPYDLTEYNGKLLFDGKDANGNYSLWITDGTAAGTQEITGVQGASTSGLDPGPFKEYNGKLLFNGLNASGNYTFWTTDGTAAGTQEITGVQGASASGLDPRRFAYYNGKILFNGRDTGNNYNLWTTDGTAAGTQEIAVQGGSPTGISPNYLTPFNGKLLFRGYNASNQSDLWTTDGTAAGTQDITGVQGASASAFAPQYLTPYNGKVLFEGKDAGGNYNLWTTDGTAAGTQEIAVQGASASGLAPSNFTKYNGKLLFEGKDAGGNYNLWTTDGTAAGTQEIAVQGASASGLAPSNFTKYNGKLLFEGKDAGGNYNLWTTDGTAAGTQEITSVPGAFANGLSPFNLIAVPGTAPTLTAAQAVADAAGPLNTGHVISFTLTASADLTLDTTYGSPTLMLSDGATATFDPAASTSTALVFRATIAPGDNTADLRVTGLALNTARITEFGGTPLDASALATLPGSDTGLVIDTTAPVVTAAAVADPAQASVSGQKLAGGGDPNATVTIQENGSAVGSAQAGANGSWTFDPSALAPGAHNLTASETDAAGNTGAAPVAALTVPDPRFTIADLPAATSASVIGADYHGQVSYLQAQYGYSGANNVVLGAKVANVFMYSGAGEDALAARAGSNVLDGGAGSNWLVGASGADGGKDTFFVDGGNGQSTWDTLLNFHAGDMLTLWGYNGASGSMSWSDNKGSAGYQGATLAAKFGDAAGSSTLVTFGGQSTSGAHFVTSTGTSGGLSYLAVTRTA